MVEGLEKTVTDKVQQAALSVVDEFPTAKAPPPGKIVVTGTGALLRGSASAWLHLSVYVRAGLGLVPRAGTWVATACCRPAGSYAGGQRGTVPPSGLVPIINTAVPLRPCACACADAVVAKARHALQLWEEVDMEVRRDGG